MLQYWNKQYTFYLVEHPTERKRVMLENILQHTSCITKKSLNYTIIFLPSTMQVPLFGTKLPSLRNNSNARRMVPPWKILNRSTVVIRKGEQRREQGASTDRLEFNDSSARYRYTHFIHAFRSIPLDVVVHRDTQWYMKCKNDTKIHVLHKSRIMRRILCLLCVHQ